jgi:hypothetical protein
MGLFDSIRSALGLGQKRPESDEQLDHLDHLDPDHADGSGARDKGVGAALTDEPSGQLAGDFDTTSFDAGGFDFERDIARYFTAEFRIETATHDPARRELLFAEYDVRNLEHWQRIQAAFERWLETPAAKAKYRTPGDLMQARMTTTQTMTLADLGIERVKLDPINGVTLEVWAKAEAALEGGAEFDTLIAELGVDAASWAKIAAAWHERMVDDASGRIATEYSLHVGNAGPGKFTAKTRPSS